MNKKEKEEIGMAIITKLKTEYGNNEISLILSFCYNFMRHEINNEKKK